MATVLGRISNYSQCLTPSESRVADYLRSHPEEVIKNSIQEVARNSGVSVASVSRLATTLGYRDWKDMRLNLAKDSSAPDNPVFSDITKDDSDEMVTGKVFDGAIMSLRDTFEQMDKKSISRLVAAIRKTDRIVFFGSGGSGCIARDESLRFAHLELAAEAYSEEFQMMLQASRMKKGQIAFGFSNSGRSWATVGVLEEARRNKALTVGIANYRNTPLEDASDIFFCTSFPRRGEFTAALTARIPIMCIMDAIYVLAVQHGMLTTKVGHVDHILEKNLRLPAKRQPAGKGKNGRA
ncbi:MAG: MurR/RpiR family transcriptional regulator [Planctomycetaceae bacterium]|nr:MurR/RpiR family transcriptional regulator [Planctomycetaceae bacterium]